MHLLRKCLGYDCNGLHTFSDSVWINRDKQLPLGKKHVNTFVSQFEDSCLRVFHDDDDEQEEEEDRS